MRRLLVLLLLLVGGARCRVAPVTRAPDRPAGEAVRFLTSDSAAMDYWPCFSPDGRLVLFSRSLDGGKTWALFTVPVAGGAVHKVAGSALPPSANRPSWSRRSGRIAFTAEEPNDRGTVWIMEGDGSQARQVRAAGLSDHAYYPSWYPDDKYLAVVDFDENDRGVVKRIDLERHTATALTDAALTLAGMPSVSPDGKRIAFAGQQNLGHVYDQSKNSIWLLVEGGRLQNIVPGQGRTPAWSADGQWLAFESNRGSAADRYAAFIVRRDGSRLSRVTGYELNANHPMWSPDGTLLVVSGRHTRDLATTGIAVIQLRER